MSMLQNMTESLFSETLKRIAEDVWKQKLGEVLKRANYVDRGEIQEMFARAFSDALKNDPELREKAREVIVAGAHAYFDALLKKESK